MSLARFFDQVAPMLLGTASPEETARTLYAAEPGRETDAARLAIYARFCRVHRFEAIETIFPHCRAAIERELGRPAWEALVETYHQRHPMQHVELNSNGAQWPEFVAGHPPGPVLPAWLPSLADFEWWEWQTIVVPEPADGDGPDSGPLRLAPTLELRPYGYDLVQWIDDGSVGSPAELQCFVLFWRDRERAMRRENADPLEMLTLKSIAEGTPLTNAFLKKLGTSRVVIDETIEDLREAGILHGR